MLIGWDIFLIIFQRMIHNVTEETTPAQCLSDSARLLCTQPKHFHPDCSWPTLERSSELKRLSLFMGEADAAEKYGPLSLNEVMYSYIFKSSLLASLIECQFALF